MQKYVAFIPVRGGSKSIALKNIKLLNGRPLVYWVIDAATKCEQIEKVYISTDSEEIKDIVLQYDSAKIVVIGRSDETATDKASTESAMIEFAENHEFENIILIQATSPLLTSEDLEKGIELHKREHIDSVVSGVDQKRFIWQEKNGVGISSYDYYNRPLRQNFDGYFVENGAFYITSKKRLLENKCRISGNIGLLRMPEETYYEIDEPEDWVIVEQLIKSKQSSN